MASIQRSFVFARELNSALSPPPVAPAITRQVITQVDAADFPALERFCIADGFPAGWAERMLTAGREAHLLLDERRQVIGSAWIARGPYFISEIRRTFDAGAEVDYYFGDFVSPAHRGRKLHRALIEMRLEASRAAGRAWAVAMTHANNAPSVAGYRSAGFRPIAQLQTRRMRSWQIDSVKWLVPRRLSASFSTEGLWLPGLGRLRHQ